MKKLVSIFLITFVAVMICLSVSCGQPSLEGSNDKENSKITEKNGEAEGEAKKSEAVNEDKTTGSEETSKQDEAENGEDKETEGSTEKVEEEYVNDNDFTLLDLDGNKVSLSDFEGKIVVLNFWSTWCPPCKAEIPDFIEVYNLYKDKNVQFLGVADDNVKSLRKFASDYGINYPILVDGTIDSISSYWRIRVIPTTFIVDVNGKAIFWREGMLTKDQLIKVIKEACKC